MRTFLHQRVAEALRRIRREVQSGDPQWCFEIGGLPAEDGIRALLGEFRHWKRGALFAYFDVGDKTRCAVVDLSELERLIEDAVVSGNVVGVVDGTTLGGCAFDFTDEEGGTVELLVTCWGNRESTADRLLERFPEGCTFRGNG